MAETSKAIDKAYLEKQFQDYTEELKENFVDSELSADSTYPVQNKVVTEALRNPAQGVNLVLNSGVEIRNNAYLMNEFYLSEPFVNGEIYTITIWGELGEGKNNFHPYIGNGSNSFSSSESVIEKQKDGIYSSVLTCRTQWSANADLEKLNILQIYVSPASVHSESIIHKIKVEKGAVENPIWTPAPEDSLELMDDVANLENTVEWLDKRAVVANTESKEPTKQWYKFASITTTSNAERSISFKARSILNNANLKRVNLGILTASINRVSSGIERAELIWEYASDSLLEILDNFILIYHENTADLWCKCGKSYTGYIFEVLDEGSQGNHGSWWTVYTKRSEEGDLENLPSEGIKVPSTLMTLANPAKVDGIVGGRNYLRSPYNSESQNAKEATRVDWSYDEKRGVYNLIYSEYVEDVFKQITFYNMLSDIQKLKGKRCLLKIEYADWSWDDANPSIFLRLTSNKSGTQIPNAGSIQPGLLLNKKKETIQIIDIPDSDEFVAAYLLIRMSQSNGGNIPLGSTMTVRGISLTIGDIQTDWTPNPEDFMAMPVEQRRNTFRGKNLGSVYTDEQKAAVAAGTFDDLFIGDYWVIDSVTWRIVDINYWLNTGDTSCTTPHLVIMPDSQLYTGKMNSENTTAGGYVGSEMYKTGLNQAKEMINSAFGESYILNHREYLTNAVTDGHDSGGGWFNSTVELPSEIMMYSSYIFNPAGNGTFVPYRYTIDKTQLALMMMYPRFINPARQIQWLRNVVSGANFAIVGDNGYASENLASNNRGVRPVFGLIGTPAA